MLNRKLILSILTLTLIILAAGSYYFYLKPQGSQYDVRNVSGYVTGVKGDVITIKGFYEPFGEPLPPELRAERDITFKVGPETLLGKTEVRLPSKEELIARGLAKVVDGQYSATYTLDEQSKVVSAGSLDDIKGSLSTNGISVEVEFAENIYRVRNPVASSISYMILIAPSQ